MCNFCNVSTNFKNFKNFSFCFDLTQNKSQRLTLARNLSKNSSLFTQPDRYSFATAALDCSTTVRTNNGIESKDCVFPFKFKGKTYASCTKDHTTNDKAWCATEVDSSGNVVDSKWGDCDADCFSSKFLTKGFESFEK